ncbi:MAG: phage shock protein PspA [Desulfovibrio sp.]|uniref:phage shock protein PspA n=1 Tax=Desulfovibrio sp. 7SRBS1 TaxID=3378064 RepID=UPI003B400AEB
MGIFSRFKDIVTSNFNHMLDRAEDPEKMIRLMIREMEETLVEIKSSCAASMADRKRMSRDLDNLRSKEAKWDERARLAMERGREDLAREALVEKKRLSTLLEELEAELAQGDAVVEQAQEDIGLLEEKLAMAKDKQRSLIKRHARAKQRKQARQEVRKLHDNETFLRFHRYEQRIERMEAEADVEGPHSGPTMEDEFRRMEADEDVEKELQDLKKKVANKD